jgi:hypothetical protein
MEAIRAMSPAEFHDAAPQTCHWCDRERLAAAPTPDREALRERIGNILDGELCAVTRHGSMRERAVVRERALDRILDLLAALPGGREQERLYCGFPPCDFWCHADTAPYFDNCPKCLGSFSFARPRRRPTAAPQASADTREPEPCGHPESSLVYPALGGKPVCVECSGDRLSVIKTTRDGAVAAWTALDEAGIDAQLTRGPRGRWRVWFPSADHGRALTTLRAARAAASEASAETTGER